MEVFIQLIIFCLSLGALLYASDRFVDSAESIGLSFGISPFIIGVTIIAFGTSLPELATSIASVFSGTSEIVIGNVIGSNITNILLVLGVTAYVGRDIILDKNILDVDMPLLFGSAFLLFLCLQDGKFGWVDMSLFLVGLIIFLVNSLKSEKVDKVDRPSISSIEYIVLVIAGLGVYIGAKFAIDAIEKMAYIAQIDPHLIALTVVALGTSLPELIVSIAAARKGKHAMAIGNVLGSNIFNTYAVMGISALFGNLVIPPSVLEFDLVVMLLATILFGVVCIGGKIHRWEGAMLLLFYAYFIFENIKNVV